MFAVELLEKIDYKPTSQWKRKKYECESTSQDEKITIAKWFENSPVQGVTKLNHSKI